MTELNGFSSLNYQTPLNTTVNHDDDGDSSGAEGGSVDDELDEDDFRGIDQVDDEIVSENLFAYSINHRILCHQPTNPLSTLS